MKTFIFVIVLMMLIANAVNITNSKKKLITNQDLIVIFSQFIIFVWGLYLLITN